MEVNANGLPLPPIDRLPERDLKALLSEMTGVPVEQIDLSRRPR